MNPITMRRLAAYYGAIVAAVLFVGVSSASALVTEPMGPGSTGSQVSELQTLLAGDSTLYPEGLVTGYYGAFTVKAVQGFQCKYAIACSGSVTTNGYGRVGPVTLMKIASLQNGTVFLPPVGFPNPGADVNAPVMSKPAAATTSTSAVITWSTSEPSHNRVMYGTSWPFLYASAANTIEANATANASPTVTLAGLVPNTTYYYTTESIDASGNLQWGIGNSFRTLP